MNDPISRNSQWNGGWLLHYLRARLTSECANNEDTASAVIRTCKIWINVPQARMLGHVRPCLEVHPVKITPVRERYARWIGPDRCYANEFLGRNLNRFHIVLSIIFARLNRSVRTQQWHEPTSSRRHPNGMLRRAREICIGQTIGCRAVCCMQT